MLTAYRRFPPSKHRRRLALSYQRWAPFTEVVARLDEARDAAEREDWIVAFGYKLGQEAQGAESLRAEGEVLRRIYPTVVDSRRRAMLAQCWRSVSSDLEILIPLETDRELRDVLERAAAAPRYEDARRILKEYLDR
jgi:hypothetical protein